MKCLIIAAGQGTRISRLGDSKPLIPLNGMPLIQWVISINMLAGITEFYVVIGYNGHKIKEILEPFALEKGIVVHFIHNHEWEKANGISVLRAKEYISDNFILTMSDHIYEPALLETMKAQPPQAGEVKLAVDYKIRDNSLVDLDDVTRVAVRDGFIVDIGKHLHRFDAFDTGIFYCTPALFDALEQSIREGDESLSGGMRILGKQNKAKVVDIGSARWIDVDDENMYEKAKAFVSTLNSR